MQLPYLQRLSDSQKAREAKYSKALPLQRPNNSNESGIDQQGVRTMAEKPANMNEPQQPSNRFTDLMSQFSDDGSLKFNQDEFVTGIEALRQKLEPLGIPDSIKESYLDDYLQTFMTSDRMSSNAQQNQQAIAQMMGGLSNGL